MSNLLTNDSKLFLSDKIICLVGFMGSGKSYIGNLIAQELSAEFIDTDLKIEQDKNQTIKTIFKDNGEKYFRKIERQLLKNLVFSTYNENKSLVIATGGGTFLNKSNQKLVKQFYWDFYNHSISNRWIVIALNPSFEVIYNRIKGSHRPLVFRKSRKFVFNLWSSRYKLYQQISHLSISDSVTENIFSTLNQRLNILQKPYICLINKKLSKNEIVLQSNQKFKEYPLNVTNLIEQNWTNLIKTKTVSNKYLYNGIVYSLKEYNYNNDILTLKIQPTDYKSYLGTNISNIDLIKNKNHLANILAACVVTITKDNYCVIGKRSNKLAEGSTQWHIIGGTIEPKTNTQIYQPEHPYELIIKELKEEINISESQIKNLSCTGFGLSVYNNKPEFLFVAFLNINLQQLKLIITNAKDYDEHSEYKFIKTTELMQFVNNHNVTPIGQLAIKLALENDFI